MLMRFRLERSTVVGGISLNRRKTDIIGKDMHDPFYDSYQQEADTCCDIIEKIDKSSGKYVHIIFDKGFLRKIVRSHLLHIREVEKFMAPSQG